MARLPRPVVIDEAQKAPPVFDAIKMQVDKKRIPGEFVITGSSTFSSKVGIRESLTGRIGLLHLRPLCLAELDQVSPLETDSFIAGVDRVKPRFSSGDVSKSMQHGGMPGVAFIRDVEHRNTYWNAWLETTLTRDLPRVFKRNYDPDVALSILQRIGYVLAQSDLPTLHHFLQPARQLRQYLSAFEEVFLVDRIPCHPLGKSKDIWLMGDAGLANYLMDAHRHSQSPSQLSLVRHFLWNEWFVRHSQHNRLRNFAYYKSAQGSPIDAIIDDVPILITADASAVAKRLSWLERPLRGAMKTLGAKSAIIVAPIDHTITAKSNDGVAVVPWSAWC